MRPRLTMRCTESSADRRPGRTSSTPTETSRRRSMAPSSSKARVDMAAIRGGERAVEGEATSCCWSPRSIRCGQPVCGHRRQADSRRDDGGGSGQPVRRQAGFTIHEAVGPGQCLRPDGYHLWSRSLPGALGASHSVWTGADWPSATTTIEGQVVEYWFLDVEDTPVMVEAGWFLVLGGGGGRAEGSARHPGDHSIVQPFSKWVGGVEGVPPTSLTHPGRIRQIRRRGHTPVRPGRCRHQARPSGAQGRVAGRLHRTAER